MANVPQLPEPIAIIGSGCRLPGKANSPSKLWELLKNPRDLLKKIDRFDADKFFHPDGLHHGTAKSRHAYLLDEDHRLFDTGFFGIKPVEAESIDPLQRLLLETVYESLEDAGVPLEKLQGSDTAFYAGVMQSDYNDLLMRDVNTFPQYFATSTSRSIISNRVSYIFDWHGPSMTIDTACSSSMVALHLAVKSLRSRECQVALAAGGNLFLGPELFIGLSKLSMLSSQGRSAMWDADVDGYGRGEAFVSVVLKRLSDAIRDGDHIDCIIRETGANQDGRTKGITMPSATAQADLIRRTYETIGLDVRKPEDQPQFFEAHGTGTKAGDPQEAQAIFDTFFGPGFDTTTQKHPLYVGGIKTIIGHTEGSAGLAGLMKAMLSLQNGIISPNLLFKNLNPDILPFYGPLELPVKPTSWPQLPEGTPRRASVNSFGFGGANTHAILESPPAVQTRTEVQQHDSQPLMPFLFSAHTESALQRLLYSYNEYLKTRPETNLSDLAWTLSNRRSALSVKCSIAASSIDDLCNSIDAKLGSVQNTAGATIGVRAVTGSKKILGIFTGQGAQWARMGYKLMKNVPRVMELVEQLNAALQQLPEQYRPAWTIEKELAKGNQSSQIQEAVLSQPLCTVIQVILIDILRSAGVTFSAVVGHSSGEIAAAHAAGFFSAIDAVKIAYLRGYHASLAQGVGGEKGAMMAVGLSIEEATELCNSPEYSGRVKLAACNSPSSLTLSGDADAIESVKAVLDGQKKFARLLKVDTAYHSHHMQPCAEPYMQSLNAADIKINTPSRGCTWYSSVLNGAEVKPTDSLIATYWRDNMAQTVMFSQAVTSAVRKGGSFHQAIEVGPHPALKGPVMQILGELDVEIPYTGTLRRGEDDLQSVSSTLGTIWSNLGPSEIDFESLHREVLGPTKPMLLKGLPTYTWDHEKPYWYESRKSKVFRTRPDPVHELLGARCDEGNGEEYQWRNFLSIHEIPWLEGHQIQGSVVFPAAGYASMALEASRIIARDEEIQLLQIEDLVVGRAIVFQDEKTAVETVTNVWNIKKHAGTNGTPGSIAAEFTISAQLLRDHTSLVRVCSGKINIIISDEPISESTLPPKSATPSHLIPIDTDRFYKSLDRIGYGYTKLFQGFSEMRRRLNFSTGLIEQDASYNAPTQLLVHPSALDHAFQALFGAYCWPGDGRFWTLFLPVSIGKISVDPLRCRRENAGLQGTRLAFDAWLSESPSNEMRGDVVFSATHDTGDRPIMQVEGASMVALGDTAAQDDRSMFFETVWGPAVPDGGSVIDEKTFDKAEWELVQACEQVALHYGRKVGQTLTTDEGLEITARYKDFMSHPALSSGQVIVEDENAYISGLIRKYSQSIDMRFIASAGQKLPSILHGELKLIDELQSENLLSDFFANSSEYSASNRSVGHFVKQLAHRYPRMNFFEIGGGTGSTTQAVLKALNGAYSSYTFTDVEVSLSESMSNRFETEGGKVAVKSYDMYQPLNEQGFTPNSYDVVIASNILGQAPDLQKTLPNVRSLLKAGGYLVLVEVTDPASFRHSLVKAALSGGQSGAGECRSPTAWSQALRKAGFGGVDTAISHHGSYPSSFLIMGAQAVDDKIDELRKPLLRILPNQAWNSLYILGGDGIETYSLAEDISSILSHHFDDVIVIGKLDAVLDIELDSHATVIGLLDLEGPVFRHLNPTSLKALQRLVEQTRNVLWVTHSQDADKPYANQSVGFFRTVTAELPTLRAQVLDFDNTENPSIHGRVISECLLRLLVAEPWEQNPDSMNQILWTTEPELRFKNGKLWVQRVIPNKLNNQRLNGIRRTMHRDYHEGLIMELSENNGSWALKEHYAPKSLPSTPEDDIVAIRVRYSTLWAPKYYDEELSLHLVAGQPEGKDDWVIALTDQRRNVVHVRASEIVALPEHETVGAHAIFTALIAEIIASRISQLAKDSSSFLLVQEPDDLIASVLLRKSQEKLFKVKFLTEYKARKEEKGSDWLFLHPRQPIRAARQVVPSGVTAYVYLGVQADHDLVNLVSACVSHNCKIVNDSFIASRTPYQLPGDFRTVPESLMATLADLSTSASTRQLAIQASRSVESHTLKISELQRSSTRRSALALVDWQSQTSVPMEISQPRPDLLFKKNRSYMLVGMTGEMGLSLARWMISHGAGGVILTSRNPKIHQAWIDEMESSGAKIKIGAFNATSRDAWLKFQTEIENDMPPLAGVINGAVILKDQMFLDMDVNVFNDALAPKIDITIHLDEVFGNLALDFFIVFSSLSFIIGNRGQTNYNSGNAFVTSFLKQRRARGQAASVLHLGSVVGVGYLTRAGDVMEQILLKYGYMPVSEFDLHHLVAQAIMVGLPGSEENPEMITGLRYAREDEETGVHWSTNPRFSHMILPPIESNEKTTSLSTRAQLEAAVTVTEAEHVVETSLSTKIMAILQMESSSFRQDAPLIELGVDSLVAVEIRAWALKEVNVDMTVLKILGGATTTDLSRFAVEQMAEEMLPNIGKTIQTTTAEAKSEQNTTTVGAQKPVPVERGKPIHNQQASTKDSSQSATPTIPLSSGFQTPLSSVASEEAQLPAKYDRRVRLSSAQSRFWFLNMFLADKTSSNVTLSFKIRGRIRVSDFAKAVEATARAHEILRTCFVADEESSEKAWQVVLKKSKLKLEHRTVLNTVQIADAYKSVRNNLYNLEQGETMRILLLTENDKSHTIIFGYHHIILDGVGFQVFLADLERSYNNQFIAPEGLQYIAFSEEEGLSINKGSLEENLTYWKREFDQIPPVLPLLPFSKVTYRRAISSYGSTYVERRLHPELSAQMKAVCQKLHVTTSHFYLATYRVLLARLAGVEDICIGLADANRHDRKVMSTVGLFLNSLPLHFVSRKNKSFDEVLRETRDKVYAGLGHAGVPFDEVLQALRLPRSSSHSPLFQAFFDYHQGAMEKLKFSNTAWEVADRNPGETAYDITLDIVEGGAGSLVSFMGQSYLYGPDEMQKVIDCYVTLLESFVKNPNAAQEQAKIFSQPQLDVVLELGQGPHIKFEWSATLAHRVHEICQQYPDMPAVSDGQGKTLTYKDVALKALAICKHMSSVGVSLGDKVCVLQEPTPDWICSMIAIFWSGAVYVPLVPTNPLPRLNAMVESLEPKVILSHGSTDELASQLISGGAEFINVDQAIPDTNPKEFSISVAGEDLAVILFTSGSTGTPKGIKLRHRNIVNHIEGYVKEWKIGREVVLQQSAFSFDLSMGQIFTALSMGGTLVVASAAARSDPTALAALMRRENITWTLLTPSEYASVLEANPNDLAAATSWKHALACGEVLPRKTVRAFAKLGHPTLRLYNAYGPAEAVISATMAEISLRDNDDDGPVTIGRPNPNYSIYIVDDDCNTVPQGFPGEILIGGCAVGIGYLNEEALTAEKFIANPFASKTSQPLWTSAYRTGDKGRFEKDGLIRYEGRRDGDSQVKIRGYRVELGDIEASLLKAANGVLVDAVVTLGVESQVLVAHAVFARHREPASPAKYLAELISSLPLPAYMKPTMAFPIAKFPKNLHGKTDRKAIANLPLPLDTTRSSEDTVALSPLQESLVHTWRDVLPSEFAKHFSIDANTEFFAVGGNSLLLVKLQARIRADFNVSIGLLQLMEASTLKAMAACIQASDVVKEINWDEETELDSEILSPNSNAATVRADGVNSEKLREGKVVLLTGATGYFGSYILRQLVESPDVQSIHCVAVRGNNQINAEGRVSLSSHPKVTVHAGDLTSPHFGLDGKTWRTLANTVDLIIHSGSRRSFWDNYWALRGANVTSTKELLRLAAPRSIPMHFLSSSGVLKLNDSIDGSKETSVARFAPPTDGSEGYVASKWASEVLLERASREAGVPVVVHRFTPREDTSPSPVSDIAMDELVTCTELLGILPDRATWEGRFDVIHSPRTAARICAASADAPLTFVHHRGEASYSPTQLFDVLEGRLGDSITKTMDMLEWVGAIKRTGYTWLFSTHELVLTTTEHGITTKLVNVR